MKFVLFCQNAYAFGILAPIRDVLSEQGEDYIWFVATELLAKFPFPHEAHTTRILDLQYYKSDVIFVPGNEVPYYLRGVKTQIFHGLAGEKKGHFRIRHYFDLYLTQGPYFTNRFNQLKEKHRNFDVIETGWPKLDIYGKEKNSYDKEKNELLKKYATDNIILYAPTFSPSLTSASELFDDIENLALATGFLILVKFHDLMNVNLIAKYKSLAEKHENVVFQEEKNIIKFLLLADVIISDTSSVIYEFLLLNKPAISYKTESAHIKWDNLTQKGQLTASVLNNLKNDQYEQQRIALNEIYHPYQDGRSAERMISAVKAYINKNGVPEQRKLPVTRKIKMNTKFGSPVNKLWNGNVKNKLSTVLITFNEISNIDEVLTNVEFADEIIVVDSFSTDGTVERIKKRPNVKLIQRPFVNYTDQKSFAMSQASNDWVLFMDADERLTDRLKNEVLTTINEEQEAVAFYFYRTFMFQEKVLRFSGWQSDKNFRLFRKSKVHFTKERVVHETLVVDGKTGILKNKLIHYSYKNYQDYKGKMIKYGRMKAQEEFDKNYTPNGYHFLFRPFYKFFNHYILRFGFLDGKRGITISYLNALGVYFRYQELKRLKKLNSKKLPYLNRQKPEDLSSDFKFLIIQQKMIGDVLASTILCESLKHYFPNAQVHIVANENTLPVLEGNKFIDKIVIFKKEYRSSKMTFYNFLKSLKTTEYTAVFDAYGKLESNLITFFAKSKRKIANRKWYTSWIYSEIVYQKQVSDDKTSLAISNRLMLLDPVITNNSYVTSPKLFLSAEELQTAKRTIESLKDSTDQKIIMVGVLGSGADKTYPPKYMAALLDAICETSNAKLLFNYIPSQKNEVLEIYKRCTIQTQNRIAIDFYANSLRTFMGILSQCDVLFGNEGGTTNMAKALGIPSFCIFSPFIVKGAWHGSIYKNHQSVHLRDYHPELFGEMDKREIRKHSSTLYQDFKPDLFKESLLHFLADNNT